LDESLLSQLRDDHQDVGSALRVMRMLCDDYDPDTARCRTHGETLRALDQFETDMHRHVHLENSVLFPRAIAANAALVEVPSDQPA
jgi:regulator of cell morphogenesis and NO signaling